MQVVLSSPTENALVYGSPPVNTWIMFSLIVSRENFSLSLAAKKYDGNKAMRMDARGQ